MKPGIAIIAALPREIALLVRLWPVRNTSRKDGVMIAECGQAIAVCAGMGRERVQYALTLAAQYRPLREIVSVGFAGGLRPGIARNSIHWPAIVIDAQTAQRYESETGTGTLLTTNHLILREEKPKLAARWNADLVDMEAATVAQLAAERGLPFRALKVVSDEASDALPNFDRFIDTRGHFREAAYAAHIAVHPWLVPGAIRLGRNSAAGSHALAKALREYLGNAE